ncbi:MAG TPA: hypothetical protein VJO14_05190 [Bacteroidota bacterium]|nr:hypothetical protein [Bacteroidota bacterium]
MSASDAFEWFTSTQLPANSQAVGEFIAGQRQYLYTIRSEDERQRFVEWVMGELRRMVKSERVSGQARKRG